jgi:hypothetical protein
LNAGFPRECWMGNLMVENGQSCALRIASARLPASLKT